MAYNRSNHYLNKLTKEQKETRKRILEISHKLHFSHLGSCLSAVDLIHGVYKVKKADEKFILSNGHAGVALYVILEKYGLQLKPILLEKLHVHPDRNLKLGIHVSTGSLGHGLPIALGMAMADKKRQVYCMISDGECAEGSIWESLRIAVDRKVNNLKIIVNANGWGAYDSISLKHLFKRLNSFGCNLVKVNGHDIKEVITALKRKTDQPLLLFAKTKVEQLPFLKEQDAHYYLMNDQDFNLAIDLLKEN